MVAITITLLSIYTTFTRTKNNYKHRIDLFQNKNKNNRGYLIIKIASVFKQNIIIFYFTSQKTLVVTLSLEATAS